MNALTIALSKMKRSSQPAVDKDDLEDLISEYQTAETPSEKAQAFRAMVSAVRSAPEE